MGMASRRGLEGLHYRFLPWTKVLVCRYVQVSGILYARLINPVHIGNTLQDGPESYRRERPHCLSHIYIAQQTLYPGRYEVYWHWQLDTVSTLWIVTGCFVLIPRVPELMRKFLCPSQHPGRSRVNWYPCQVPPDLFIAVVSSLLLFHVNNYWSVCIGVWQVTGCW